MGTHRFVAVCETVADMKEIVWGGWSIAMLLGESGGLGVGNVALYAFDPTCTDANDDWNIIQPSGFAFAVRGRWRKLEYAVTMPVMPAAYSLGTPASRALAFGTAYQASDPSKAAELTITLSSSASLTLGGGTNSEVDLVIGTTASIATTGGTVVGKYRNQLSGSLVVGVNIQNVAATMHHVSLPAGWYFALRVVAGTTSILSAYEQAVG